MSMPPQGIVPNLFGERKVYIGTNLCDMKPLQEITKDAITLKEEYPTPEYINATGEVMFTLKCEIYGLRKAIERLLYAYEYRKPCKTTYKTIRHDCAKRNGRR